MALNKALDTTPDAFLAGSIRCENEAWKDVAQLLRGMNGKKLDLAMIPTPLLIIVIHLDIILHV